MVNKNDEKRLIIFVHGCRYKSLTLCGSNNLINFYT